MTLKEYQEQAARTCPDLGSLERNLLHMEVGLFTEMGEILDIFKKWFAYGKEIDKVHLGEEIADVCWYQVNMDRMQGDIYAEDLQVKLPLLCSPVENEVLMNGLIYFTHSFASPLQLVYEVCLNFELDFYKLLENNINKLKVRFPDKFNVEKAINRNLELERKELER